MTDNFLSKEYTNFVEELKARVSSEQYRAARAVNSQLILLYHHVGSEILRVQKEQGWGAGVIDRLSRDLTSAFPRMKSFSPQNLKCMRKFAEEMSLEEIGKQAVYQLPWGHIIRLIYSTLSHDERLFYIRKTIEHGWSRNVLIMHMERQLHVREGKATSNFKETLPSAQSDLAENTLKDPYLFDFLGLTDKAHEREIEQALIKHMQKFLLELGAGFAFVGQQYHLEVGKEDFYIDLLFYHLKLRCYVVIELKAKEFKPEYAGKMNFYLSAVNDLLKHPDDNPSIGIILCKTKNKVVAEYALRDVNKPIGLSEYRLEEALPKNLATSLPSIEELEAELSKDFGEEKE